MFDIERAHPDAEQHRTFTPDQAEQERNFPDTVTVTEIPISPKLLCSRCADAFRRGRYFLRRVDINQPARLRSCEICRSRAYCREYQIGERADKVLRVNWRTRQKEQSESNRKEVNE